MGGKSVKRLASTFWDSDEKEKGGTEVSSAPGTEVCLAVFLAFLQLISLVTPTRR